MIFLRLFKNVLILTVLSTLSLFSFAKDVTVTVGDAIVFDVTEINVATGEEVNITLTHNGTMDKNVMGHNIVILQQDVDIANFASDAISAADTDYVPANDERVLAASDLVGGGETVTFSFTAPEPGEYVYICSFPGHYAAMQGTLTVE